MKSYIFNIILSLCIVIFTLIIVLISAFKNKKFVSIFYKLKNLTFNKNNFNFIIQNSYEGIYILDKNQRYVMVNKSYCQITEYSEDEIIGKQWPFLDYKEDLPRLKLAYLEMKDNGSSHVRIKFQTKGGLILHKELHLVRINSFLNKFNGCYVFVRDITEHVEFVQLKLLADSIPNICLICDDKGNVIFYNKVWYEVTGATYNESKNWGWQHFVSQEDIVECTRRWRECLDLGIQFQQQVRLHNSKGNYIWYLLRALPIKDKDNNIVKWFLTGTDINDFILETKI